MRLAYALCLAFLASFACAQAASPAKASEPTVANSQSTLTEDQIRDLIRKAADNDMANDKKQRDYLYTERDEQHNLDGKGQVKSTETKTYEIMEIYGEQTQKLIAKDDKPLSEKDAQKEDEKIQKLIDKRKNESPEDREKRLAKEAKEQEEDRKFVTEAADAYDFKFIGHETIEDRDNYVIDATPKPGYEPKMKEAKILTKFRGRLWIDSESEQMKKVDAECIDTVSWGLFIACIHKGSRVVIVQTRVNDEVWLPQHISVKLDARVALMKEYNIDFDVAYRDYKKFRTETKILPGAEVVEQQ
ncbi:MAG TPA: hypothetical protein VF753_20830 [Terriglobales bacterium]